MELCITLGKTTKNSFSLMIFHIHQSGRRVKNVQLLPTCFLLKHQKASMPT